MRILSCTNIYPPRFIGGAELVAHHQGKELAALGNEVQVFTGEVRDPAERYRLRSEEYDGLQVHRVGLTAEDYRMDGMNFVHPAVEEQFARLCRSFRPDIVHFHNVVGLSVGLIPLAREEGATAVVTLHDHWGFCLKNTAMLADGTGCLDHTACAGCLPEVTDEAGGRLPVRLRADYTRLCATSADALVSPSAYLANAYVAAGFPASRTSVVWNGIDVDRFAHRPRVPARGRVRFTYIGVLAPHKGVPTLLAAAAQAGAGCEVNIVGTGDRAPLERLVATLGLGERVRFWGNVPNTRIEEVFAHTDVLVLPSVWRENQPVSVTEAMACGLPVVASRSGGLVELVEDGVTGYLFEPGSAAQLAERMRSFVDDPRLAERLGAAGLARIRDNTTARQVQRLTEVYARARVAARRQEEPLPVVRCLGDQFDPVALEVLRLLPEYGPAQALPAFVREGWRLPRGARPVIDWVVDGRRTQRPPTDEALWLVPSTAQALAAACQQERRGLVYRSADEAAASLVELARALPPPAMDQAG